MSQSHVSPASCPPSVGERRWNGPGPGAWAGAMAKALLAELASWTWAGHSVGCGHTHAHPASRVFVLDLQTPLALFFFSSPSNYEIGESKHTITTNFTASWGYQKPINRKSSDPKPMRRVPFPAWKRFVQYKPTIPAIYMYIWILQVCRNLWHQK